jgi:putative membrane protein insertion efficiency factor
MTSGQAGELLYADLLAKTPGTTEVCTCTAQGHHEMRQAGWLQRRLRNVIVVYQRSREGRLSPFRFLPTFSAYALESIEVHGAGRGGWLSVRRLLRCRPLGPSGVDLVPAGRSSTTSCECRNVRALALLTPTTPTVMSSTQQKGG